jgi:hypothetical protein
MPIPLNKVEMHPHLPRAATAGVVLLGALVWCAVGRCADLEGPDLGIGTMAPLRPISSPSSPAQEREAGTVLVELDGTSSADPDGDRLEYIWTQIEGPPVQLSSRTDAQPYFRTSRPGVYRFALTVADGESMSDPDVVTVRVQRENHPPEARLPREAAARAGDRIVLDGTESRDADGDALTYHWQQTAGPPLYLTAKERSGPRLALDRCRAGVYEFELVVSDGQVFSAPARCQLTVRPPNRGPVARAGESKDVIIHAPGSSGTRPASPEAPVAVCPGEVVGVAGEPVVLDASRSYSPLDRPLRFYWRQRGGPFVRSFERIGADGARLRFTPPEIGRYEMELVVSDGAHDSPARTVAVRVVEGNAAPVAAVATEGEAKVGQDVVLDGSESFDREGAALAYRWRQVGGPRARTFGMEKETPQRALFIPEAPGAYVFELTVNDGEKDSRPARAVVVVEHGNRLANVQTVGRLQCAPGETVVLQATGEDPDGDRLTFQWRQVAGPALLAKPAQQQKVALEPEEEGVYRFEATAHDGTGVSKPALCLLRVETPNRPPEVRVPSHVEAHVGEPVVLDATATRDPDGDPLLFRWTIEDGDRHEQCALHGATTAEPLFTPEAAGTYRLRLSVSDGRDTARPVVVRVEARPRAEIAGESAPGVRVAVRELEDE